MIPVTEEVEPLKDESADTINCMRVTDVRRHERSRETEDRYMGGLPVIIAN